MIKGMGMSHTPGPWTLKHRQSGEFTIDKGDWYIADTFGCCDANGFLDDRESIANAHLIAAAPEMLNTLEIAGHVLRSYQHGNSATDLAKEAADLIDAVVAAAKGQ